jgi:hypothetical protein
MEFLETVLTVYSLFGFEFHQKDMTKIKESIMKSYLFMRASMDVISWVKLFKYKIVAHSAFLMNQPPPLEIDLPEYLIGLPHMILGGKFYSWVRSLNRTQRFQLGVSILSCKAGCPAVTKEQIMEAERDNVIKMSTKKRFYSTPLPIPEVRNRTRCIEKHHVRTHIDKSVKRLVGSTKFSYEEYSKPFLASVNSNYTSTRSQLGTLGTLEEEGLLPKSDNPMTVVMDSTALFTSEDFCRKMKVEVLERSETGYRGESLEVPELEEAYCIDDFELRLRFQDHISYVAGVALLEEDPYVSVVGLPEPLKIRVISKGPPLTYYALKPLQQQLWKLLQKHPCFVLTGKTVDEGIITSHFGFMPESTRFLSGDYSSATDEMFRYVSKAVVRSLCRHMDIPPLLSELFMRALVGHTYHLDSRYGQDEGFYVQRNGQLMGSIVSFPVLCIANYCCITMAQYYSGNLGKPFLINGDDNVSAYNEDTNFYTVWNRVASLYGFHESIGKTYDSSYFLCINSRFYFLTDEFTFEPVPFVNFKCLRPGPETDLTNVGSRFRDLIKNGSSLGPAFIYYHHNILKQFAGSWFLPEYLGGLGLWSKNHKWTFHDYCYVHYMKHNFNRGRLSPLSIPMEKKLETYGLLKQWVKEQLPPHNLLNCHFSSMMPITHFVLAYIMKEGLGPLKVKMNYQANVQAWKRKAIRLYKVGSKKNDMYYKDQYIVPIKVIENFAVMSTPLCEAFI